MQASSPLTPLSDRPSHDVPWPGDHARQTSPISNRNEEVDVVPNSQPSSDVVPDLQPWHRWELSDDDESRLETTSASWHQLHLKGNEPSCLLVSQTTHITYLADHGHCCFAISCLYRVSVRSPAVPIFRHTCLRRQDHPTNVCACHPRKTRECIADIGYLFRR
jgi:hypothetical protein